MKTSAFQNAIVEPYEIFKLTFSLLFRILGRVMRNPLGNTGVVIKRWPEIMDHAVKIGIGSLPIITISTAFAGLVVSREIAWHMDQALHTVSMIPGFTGQFILREIGIAVPALLLVAKVGAAITAEIGSMKVTEQVDALKILGIDPVEYLVLPRFFASILASVCLVLIASAVTLTCAILVAILRFNFNLFEYITALRHTIIFGDLVCTVTKGFIFGAVIPLIASAYGFRCRGGAEGVGSATTNSVVSATVTVIALDFFLTYLFTLILA